MVKKKRYPEGHTVTAGQSGAAVINEKSRCPARQTDRDGWSAAPAINEKIPLLERTDRQNRDRAGLPEWK